MKYTAFLRAINVTGYHRIKMDLLRDILSDYGIKDVSTYLQSGNVVFKSEYNKKEVLESQLETLLYKKLGLEVSVFVKSKKEIATLLVNNPFLDKDHEEQFLHATFFKGKNNGIDTEAIEKIKMENEEFKILGSSVYLYCPNGYGRTKLNNANWEKWSKCKCTTRNWNTIKAIDRLM